MLLIATLLLFKTLLWLLYLDSISVIHPDILKLESTFQLELFSSLFIGAFLVICVFFGKYLLYLKCWWRKQSLVSFRDYNKVRVFDIFVKLTKHFRIFLNLMYLNPNIFKGHVISVHPMAFRHQVCIQIYTRNLTQLRKQKISSNHIYRGGLSLI